MGQREKFTVFDAGIAWLLVHIYYLVSLKRQLFVVMQWAWSYRTW